MIAKGLRTPRHVTLRMPRDAMYAVHPTHARIYATQHNTFTHPQILTHPHIPCHFFFSLIVEGHSAQHCQGTCKSMSASKHFGMRCKVRSKEMARNPYSRRANANWMRKSWIRVTFEVVAAQASVLLHRFTVNMSQNSEAIIPNGVFVLTWACVYECVRMCGCVCICYFKCRALVSTANLAWMDGWHKTRSQMTKIITDIN